MTAASDRNSFIRVKLLKMENPGDFQEQWVIYRIVLKIQCANIRNLQPFKAWKT